jgi:hypothetical protein
MKWLKKLFGAPTVPRPAQAARETTPTLAPAASAASTSKPDTAGNASPSAKPQSDIPWDYIRKASADNDAFFNEHKASLSPIFARAKAAGRDPVLMLVAFEQEKWRALLALLYKRPQNMHFAPEMFIGGATANISNNGYCDVYVPPMMNGQAMRVGVYVLEREWLASELCWVKGLPPIFIQLVKEDKRPGNFDIVVFAPNGMRVEHLPLP